MTTVLSLIKKLEDEEGAAQMQRLLEEANKLGIDAATVNRYVIELERSGDVFRPRAGIIKIIRHENE